MATVGELIGFLNELAPLGLAEEWDNVGLLVGDERRSVSTALTCLSLTPEVAAEAIALGVQLVVTHHPVLFQPIKRLTTETSEGRMLIDLIAAGVSVYSAHTAYDSASEGINQQIAERLGLRNIASLRAIRESQSHHEIRPGDQIPGSGRFGFLPKPMPLDALLAEVKECFGLDHLQYVPIPQPPGRKPRIRASLERLQYVGSQQGTVTRLGIACGSAADFMHDAARHGCEAFLTGEARFHACLEARSLGMAMILVGHYASERPAMEQLAEILQAQFKNVVVHASKTESDPLRWA